LPSFHTKEELKVLYLKKIFSDQHFLFHIF
jgi:hypothetical protein